MVTTTVVTWSGTNLYDVKYRQYIAGFVYIALLICDVWDAFVISQYGNEAIDSHQWLTMPLDTTCLVFSKRSNNSCLDSIIMFNLSNA